MADEMVKDDADAGEKLDKLLSALDSMAKRMDALEAGEEKKADDEMCDDAGDGASTLAGGEEDRREGGPERVVADKRKDESEEVEAKKADDDDDDDAKKSDDDDDYAKKADKARRDAEEEEKEKMRKDSEEIARRIADVESRLPKRMSDADYAAMADAQARADAVYSAFGDRAPRALEGETPLAYRRRLAKGIQQHSPKWKKSDLALIASVDSAAFAEIENDIYADALVSAKSPADIPFGELRAVNRVDSVTGHRMTEFYGEPRSWMARFSTGRRKAKLNLSPNAGR